MTTHQQPPAITRKSVTGFVTKLVGDSATYGFINDEIFFQQMNVVGSDGPAGVNDRVFAECEYSAHLPIKWNATSVKILSKAGAGHSQPIQQQPLQAANLESDPRKQSRQSLLNQQSQSVQPPTSIQSQQFNPQQQQQQPVNAMASTYQQHRQQRQQLQTLDSSQPHDNDILQTDQSMRLLDQPSGNPTDLYYAGINNQQPFVTAQPQMEVPPFQETPMGPPKITFTSQLGSAFVQSPMISPAFLQQPPPVLPQQHPPGLGQPNNQHNHQRPQQHGNQHNKGARFNNQNDKNDRHPNRRDRNDRSDTRVDRNDSKFNNSNRSNDRDNSFSNRSSRQNDSRDRSANRGQQTKRNDDTSSRPSPPVQSSSMRSTTSVSSERGANKTRRNYEAQNIPKSLILTDLNSWNMKNRCSSSIHVPSDLKYIRVNPHLRLDVKHTPKPLTYSIEPVKSEGTNVLIEDDNNPTEEESVKSLVLETSVTEDKAQQRMATASLSESQDSGNSTIANTKDDEKTTPTMSKTDIGKLNHKYCVKVILLSLPELETIYKKVFGPNLDSFNSENRSNPRLDEAIELLCNKSANGGHSFIGGKFDPVLDGFVEGQTNEFERCGRQPDLIATCKRVVQEQTGLDLGPCKSWTLVSTFIYNNKSDYFSPKASVEYSFIYMPSIWTLQSDMFDANLTDKQVLTEDEVCDQKEVATPDTSNEEPVALAEPTDQVLTHEDQVEEASENATENLDAIAVTATQTSSLNPDSLTDLKVVDLKSELDRRDVKYKPNAKKAELVALLQESLATVKTEQVVDEQDIPTATVTTGVEATENPPSGDQLEEGEVASDSPEAEDGEPADAKSSSTKPEEQEVPATNKRKASDVDENSEQNGDSDNKRVCTEADDKSKDQDTKTAQEPVKVALVREPFVVKGRDGQQQQLSLVSLYDATQVSRYDQFELSVASSILRESLIQHLSEYIFTALVEDHNRRIAASNADEITSNSNELASNDSNNNNNVTKTTTGSSVSSKLPPVDRYINLAFAYFDSAHTGHLNADDLSKLFNNTNLTVSKRALVSLLGESDKFNYRMVPELSHETSSYYSYKFPEQFTRLAGFSSNNSSADVSQSGARMIEFQGVSYDVEKLIQQANESEGLRLNLVDRFNHAIKNHDKQVEEIHLLEVNQQSLSRAIKTQNDEICELKRERDTLKKRVEGMRKGLKAAIGTLSELVKDETTTKKET